MQIRAAEEFLLFLDKHLNPDGFILGYIAMHYMHDNSVHDKLYYWVEYTTREIYFYTETYKTMSVTGDLASTYKFLSRLSKEVSAHEANNV